LDHEERLISNKESTGSPDIFVL